MKRIQRDPEKYAPLEVYSELSRRRGYKLHVQEDFDAFMTSFGELLKASQSNASLFMVKELKLSLDTSPLGSVAVNLLNLRMQEKVLLPMLTYNRLIIN